MSKFVGDLILAPDHDETTAKVHESFVYSSDLLGVTLTIPKGFVTDGASVPRLFWNIIPPWGPYGQAAIVHDYLYRWQRTSRKMADAALLEAMWVSHCRAWQYICIYLAVRLGGAHAWLADQKKPLNPEELAPNEHIKDEYGVLHDTRF